MKTDLDVILDGVSALESCKSTFSTTATGSFDGRNITLARHWSTHLFIGGTIIGLISLVAGVILNDMVVAVQGGVLIATNFLAYYYIGKFYVFYSAKDLIDALTNRVSTFATLIQNLANENKQLNESAERFEKINEKKALLIKQRDTALAQLTQTVTKLDHIKQVYEPLRRAIDDFLQGTIKITATGGHIDQNIKAFIEQVKTLGIVREQLKTEIQAIEADNTELAEQNKVIHGAIQTLDKMFKEWPKKFKTLTDHNESLTKDVEALKVCVRQLEESNEKLLEIKDNFEKNVIPKMQEAMAGNS